MAVTPLSPLTCTGLALQGRDASHVSGPVVVPSPSCPELLAPQAMTVPLRSNARLWTSPAETAATPLRPPTGTGVLVQGRPLQPPGPVAVPSPSCPRLLAPQARRPPWLPPQDMTVPLLSRARLSALAETPSTELIPPAATGVLLHGVLPTSEPAQVSGPVVVPSPSCP